MPNYTPDRNWPYPFKGTKPYFTDIQDTFNAQDADVQALWDAMAANSDFWARADNVLSPLYPSDGLSVNAVGENISLLTDSSFSASSSNFIVDAANYNILNGNNNTLVSSMYVALFGSSNDLDNAEGSIVAGTDNDVGTSINSARKAAVFGSYNTVSNTEDSIVAGYNNTLGGSNYCPRNAIFGYSNSVLNGEENLVSGDSNSLGAVSNSYQSIVSGNSNTINNTESSIIVGYNTTTGANGSVRQMAIFGSGNEVSNSASSLVVGDSNDVGLVYTVEYAAVFGRSNVVDEANYAIIAGDGQEIRNAEGSIVAGYNNTVGSSTVGAAKRSFVIGDSNTLVNGDNNIVVGANHNVSNSSNAVFGYYNEVASGYNVVGGSDNTLSGGSYNAVFGSSNYSSNLYNGLMFGTSNVGPNCSFSLLGGNGNYCGTSCYESILIGKDNTITNQSASSAVFGKDNKIGTYNRGTSISFSQSGSVTTLTDTDNPFVPEIDGQTIHIERCTSSGNDLWTVAVTYISSSQISYENASGVTETGNSTTLWQTTLGNVLTSLVSGQYIELPYTQDSVIGGAYHTGYSNFYSQSSVFYSAIFGAYHQIGASHWNLIGGYNTTILPSSVGNSYYSLASGSSHLLNGNYNVVSGYYNRTGWGNSGQSRTGSTVVSFSQSGTTTTLTDSSSEAFKPEVDGHSIKVTGALSSGNNVDSAVVTYISSSQISYENATGVTESALSSTGYAITNGSSYTYVGGKENTASSSFSSFVYGHKIRMHENLSYVSQGGLSQYNVAFGGENIIESCEYAFVAGYNNTVRDTLYTSVLGTGNTVENSRASLTFGDSNNVLYGYFSLTGGDNNINQSNGSVVVGSNNTNTGSNYNIIGGINNSIDSGAEGNLVVGSGNTLYSAPNGCIIGGASNTFEQGVTRVLCMGSSNMAEYGPSNLLISGEYNKVKKSNTFTLGRYNTNGAFNRGTSVSITKGTGDEMTISLGGPYVHPEMAGATFQIEGATNTGNNGTWTITDVPSDSSFTFDIASAAGVAESGNEDLTWRLSSMGSGGACLLAGMSNSVNDNAFDYGFVSGLNNMGYQGGGQYGAMIGYHNIVGNNSTCSIVTGYQADGTNRPYIHVHSGGNPSDNSAFTGAKGQGQLLDRVPHSAETSGTVSSYLYLNGAGASSSLDLANLEDRSMLLVTYLVAKCVETGATRAWKFETLYNDIGGTSSIVGTPIKTILNSTTGLGNEATWDADSVLNGTEITFQVTGGTTETVRWQAYSMGPELGIA